MACCHCKKNDATTSYEEIKNGRKTTSYYCLQCYQKLFLDLRATEEGQSEVCPYCGTSVEEFLKSKLVGCAYCYRTMQASLMPSVVKMQGQKRAHCGKTPPLEMDEAFDENFEFDPEFKAQKIAQTRLERQCNELNLIIKKLQDMGDFAQAKEYADKLSRMKSNAAVEEEFVWNAP
ncbi:MAG: hypothetical protein IJD77_07675 [Clostridia bacterium]|nr:hypothetical protein [Clostridia bacterium]